MCNAFHVAYRMHLQSSCIVLLVSRNLKNNPFFRCFTFNNRMKQAQILTDAFLKKPF